jgi:hypothetical protein
VMCYERNWSPQSQNLRGAKLVKEATTKLFYDGIKWTCEKLKPVRWSRGGLRWKVILVSFLDIYNKCSFFFFFFFFLKKSLYFLTYPPMNMFLFAINILANTI